jgi:DNA-binding transcriptional regulator YbjK
VLDAAIVVLGTQGLRRLTHRAVDAQAGLPAGSTSNYFRTRDALVEAVVGRLVTLDTGDWEAMAGLVRPASPAELAEVLARFLHHTLEHDRVRTLARHALFVEAAFRPRLRHRLATSVDELAGWGAEWLRALGSRDPVGDARLVLAYLDGLLTHQLVSADQAFDPAPGIAILLRGMLT